MGPSILVQLEVPFHGLLVARNRIAGMNGRLSGWYRSLCTFFHPIMYLILRFG